jgi:hypothetical protein
MTQAVAAWGRDHIHARSEINHRRRYPLGRLPPGEGIGGKAAPGRVPLSGLGLLLGGIGAIVALHPPGSRAGETTGEVARDQGEICPGRCRSDPAS